MRVLLLLLLTAGLAWALWSFLAAPEEEAPADVSLPDLSPPVPVDPLAPHTEHRARLTTGTLVVTVRTPAGAVPAGARAGYRFAGQTRLKPLNAKGEARFTDAPLATLSVVAQAPGLPEVTQAREVLPGIRADVFLVVRPAPEPPRR